MRHHALLSTLLTVSAAAASQWHWEDLPPLPEALGGVFAGVVEDRLIVAGGSYWRGAPWIPGSEKVFADKIYVLEGSVWREIGRLPRPLAYGASFTHGSLWLVGGQTVEGASDAILTIDANGQVRARGKLPRPLMMSATAEIPGSYFLFGGQPDLRTCLRSSDLVVWSNCPAWPGSGRFFAQAVGVGDVVYLVGGAHLEDGKRRFLGDAYVLEDSQWSHLPDLPMPLQAGFAAEIAGRPVVLGGNDGTLAPFEAELRDKHPGFSTLIWKLDGGSWKPFGRMPYAPVTSTLVRWRDRIVIPGGEDRPAHRTARVIAGRPLP